MSNNITTQSAFYLLDISKMETIELEPKISSNMLERHKWLHDNLSTLTVTKISKISDVTEQSVTTFNKLNKQKKKLEKI